MKGRLESYLISGSLVLIILGCMTGMGYAQTSQLRLVFYNTENSFDTIDSELDDDEFLPEGTRHWTQGRYRRKINNLFKSFVLCSGWHEPDLIGLCEIENSEVLNDLISTTPLSRRNYTDVFGQGNDSRGIGVGILYNRESLSLMERAEWYPRMPDGSLLKTRSVLCARFISNNESLTVIITHWPSMRGGEVASRPAREAVASMLFMKVDSLLIAEPSSKIIIMGDLNTPPGSEVLKKYTRDLSEDSFIDYSLIYDITPSNTDNSTSGTYKYMGHWQRLDHLLMNGNLINSTEGYKVNLKSVRVVDDKVLLTEDKVYNGLKPFATWSGYSYTGGFSDHLPLVFDLFYK